MSTVNMLQAKTNLSKLVEAVESGAEEEIIIARNGKPAARLVPIAAKPLGKRKLGMFKGMYPSFTWEEWKAGDEEVLKVFEEGAAYKEEALRAAEERTARLDEDKDDDASPA